MKDREDDHTKFIIVIMMKIGWMIMLTNIWKNIMNNQHPPSSKDIFYELENLSEIKDRTILKLFETDGSGRGALIIVIVIIVILTVIDQSHHHHDVKRAVWSGPSRLASVHADTI